jgi:hypothetical protein
MKKNINVRAAMGCAAVLLVLSMAWTRVGAQQTTADIVGTVTDPSGAVVQGATVTVESLETHEIRSTTTSSGDYVVNLLKPGAYSVTVAASGFQSFSVTSVTLAAGDRTRINAQLTVGNSSQTVTVQGVASALQTDSSVLSTDIGEQPTQDLPLNGRNFVQLIQLQPGVNEGSSNGGLVSGAELDDQRQSASFEANGQSEVLNNQMIDGADNYERLIGSISVRPSIDAIAEMNVQTNTYTAEVGRTGGAMVNIITKSGTDQFHGDVFEFFRNDLFNAANFTVGQPAIKGEWRQNQYGGSLGGPIKRNKAFFFGSYEGYRLVQGLASTIGTVPTVAEEQEARNGEPIDFSDRAPTDPNYFPVPIPTSSLDPLGTAYLQLLAPPNTTETITGTDGNSLVVPAYSAGATRIQNSSVYDARVDYSFNAANSAYGRFIYNNVYTNNNGNMPAATVEGISILPQAFAYAPDIDYDALLDYIHTFNPHLVLELKAAYTRSNNESIPDNHGLNPLEKWAPGSNINTNYANSDASGLAIVAMVNGTGTSGVIFDPLKDEDNAFQYLGAVTWTRGAHNIKMGASVIRRQLTSVQSSFPEGLWVFLSYPFLAQGSFITNDGRSLELDAPHFRVWEPGFYAQDDWHARRNLTVNLGLRYDVYSPYSEIGGRIATWDIDNSTYLIGNNATAASPGIVPNAGKTAGVQTDHHGLQPRVGFAYTPGHSFVIRGGFGLSFFPMNTTSDANMKDPPFVATFNACNSPGWGANTCPVGHQTFAQGFPTPVPAQITNPGATIPDAVSIHFRNSYVEQFNLTLQKELKGNVITASYVGLLGRELGQLLDDLNAAPPGNYSASSNPNAFQQARRYYAEFPNLGDIGYFQSGGSSSYNALQLSFERRLSHGVYFNINYTHEHELDNATGLSQEDAGGYSNVPSQVDKLDYSNSPIDFRDHFAGTVSYQFPFGKNARGIRGAAIKGWQANFIQVWTSGQPFTVVNSSSVSEAIPGYDDRPNQISGWKVSNPTLGKFFNPDAFAAQAPGTLGSERRNQLYGPHFRHSDLSLFKTFPVHDRANVEFRAEAYNISNTANWGLPNATLGGSGFGQVTSMAYTYTPRVFQFALKLNF